MGFFGGLADGSLSPNAHVLQCTLRFRAGHPRLFRKISRFLSEPLTGKIRMDCFHPLLSSPLKGEGRVRREEFWSEGLFVRGRL